MTRWLVLPLGFVLVAVAGYALLSAAPPPRRSLPVATTTRAPAAAHAEIDDASRAKLRALLREADREDSAASAKRAASADRTASPSGASP